MDHKEIAMHLTLKAMEIGYIPKKDIAYNGAEDPYGDCTMCAAKNVNDFFQETLRRLNNG